MENTSTDRIVTITEAQRRFFKSGKTLDVSYRKDMLRKLAAAMEKWEEKLCDALCYSLYVKKWFRSNP